MRITFLARCFAYCITLFTTFNICTSKKHEMNNKNNEHMSSVQSYLQGSRANREHTHAERKPGTEYGLDRPRNQPFTGSNSPHGPTGIQNYPFPQHDLDGRYAAIYVPESSPSIVNPYSFNVNYSTEGEDLTLNCTVNILYYYPQSYENKLIIQWIYPNGIKTINAKQLKTVKSQSPYSEQSQSQQKLQQELQRKFPQEQNVTGNRPYVKSIELIHTLTINNLTEENKGNYTCTAFSSSNELTNSTYILNVTKTYLHYNRTGSASNLTIELTGAAQELEWIVNLNASPIAAVNWYNPRDEYINLTSKGDLNNRIEVTYDGSITALKIRDLRVSDSGIYRMRAFNLRKAITLKYYLTIRGKPTIRAYQLHPYNTLVCVVDAIPRVTAIKWTRDDCPNENHRDCEVPVLRNDTMNEYKTASVIQLTADDDLKSFTCEAKNELGDEKRSRQFKYFAFTFEEASVNSFKRILFVAFAIFAIVFGATLILLILMILIQENKNGSKPPKKNRLSMFDTRVIRQLNPRIDIEEQAHLLPYDSKWEFPKEKMYLGKMIGSGAFGLIKKAIVDGIGETNSSTAVAVKTIERNTNRLYMKLLASELKLLIYVGNHANLLNLLGACTLDFDTKKEFSTIVEYCKYGNLRDFLLIHRNSFINQVKENDEIDFSITRNVKRHKLPNIMDMPQSKARKYLYPADWRSYYQGDYRITNVKSITTKDLIRWSYQTTCGMEYLSTRKVLHGDLTARNLLLNEAKTVKICNFGLAKNIYQQDDYREIKTILMPMKWMALESIKLRKFSTQSDIWSFGVTMWEIFSLAEIPFPDINSLESLYETLKSGERLEKPPFASNELYAMMKDCWNYNEAARPSFKDLGNKLTHILENSIQSSSNGNEMREPKMTDLIQNIHLQDKMNISQEILLQIASANLSSSHSSDLNRCSIEMTPRNSCVEKKEEE